MLAPSRDSEDLVAPLLLDKLPNNYNWKGKIAYLDRDGVINKGFHNYVNKPDEVEILPGAGASIAKLRRAGFRICIVTNQSPIGRGLWSHDNLWSIHKKISYLISIEDPDAILDLILYSPYAPWEGAWSRKPNPGMLEAGRQIINHTELKSKNKINIQYGHEWTDRFDESNSIMVGDRDVDYLAAKEFGVQFYRCNPDVGLSSVMSSIFSGYDEKN